MDLIKSGYSSLYKLALAGLVIGLWSSSASAYDFTASCDGVDSQGSCGPGASFYIEKTGSAGDKVSMPFSANVMQIYLANCPTDTTCVKLVGPVFEKTFGAGVSGTWLDFAKNFSNLSWAYKLTGNIVTGANAGDSNVWDSKAYSHLCLSVTAVNYSKTWGIWGEKAGQPSGTVKCSAPINRTARN